MLSWKATHDCCRPTRCCAIAMLPSCQRQTSAMPPCHAPLPCPPVRHKSVICTTQYHAQFILHSSKYPKATVVLCRRLQEYTTAIDVWSVGCVFGELLGTRLLSCAPHATVHAPPHAAHPHAPHAPPRRSWEAHVSWSRLPPSAPGDHRAHRVSQRPGLAPTLTHRVTQP